MRFAGSTYDPTSHYRAARVLDFFEEQGLTPKALRENYLRQTALLADALGIEARREDYGGFVAVEVADAEEVSRRLAAEGGRPPRAAAAAARPGAGRHRRSGERAATPAGGTRGGGRGRRCHERPPATARTGRGGGGGRGGGSPEGGGQDSRPGRGELAVPPRREIALTERSEVGSSRVVPGFLSAGASGLAAEISRTSGSSTRSQYVQFQPPAASSCPQHFGFCPP